LPHSVEMKTCARGGNHTSRDAVNLLSQQNNQANKHLPKNILATTCSCLERLKTVLFDHVQTLCDMLYGAAGRHVERRLIDWLIDWLIDCSLMSLQSTTYMRDSILTSSYSIGYDSNCKTRKLLFRFVRPFHAIRHVSRPLFIDTHTRTHRHVENSTSFRLSLYIQRLETTLAVTLPTI